MDLVPSALLQEAVKAVPAVKYALGVAGLLAVVAIVKTFGLDPRIAIAGTVVTLVLMVALLVFAKLSATASRHFVLPALVLTWSFLVLVIAAASLLFTSAFFGVPIDLRPSASEREERPAGTDVGGIEGHVGIQLASRDYAVAWSTVEEALKRTPQRPALLELQARVAQAWVRDVRVTQGKQTFASVVEPLLPALYRAADAAEPQARADALAHLALANWLRNRDGSTRYEVETLYREALELDRENPYANAFLGHWLALGGRPLGDALVHFDAALASGREREVVRRYQISALQRAGAPGAIALIRVCNDMRRRGESLDGDTRRGVLTDVYFGEYAAVRDAVAEVLSPAEHLATLRWLMAGLEENQTAYWRFFVARLSEATGDCAAARPLYEKLLEPDLTARLHDDVEAGLARCKAR
jgi:hypothetical protein